MLIDPKPTLFLYQLLGCLLYNLRYTLQAVQVFEVAKDLAHETLNINQELVCFEWLGRTLSDQGEFFLAKIAFKKML